MKTLVNEFKSVRKDLIRIIDSFPGEKRELVLFDKWSLKNILSHLSGWAKYQTDVLVQFERGEKIKISKNLKVLINEDFVFQRLKWNWDRVYREFLETSEKLIKEYEDLPGELWEKKLYDDKETTMKDFIKTEINHYKNTHGPQIKQFLKASERMLRHMPLRYCAAIIIRNNKVLLLRRLLTDDEAGKWCPVNETIEEGELPEEAVARGVKEEVGLQFIIKKHVLDDRFDEYVYIGLGVGNLELDTEESMECGWFFYEETMLLDLAYDYRLVFQKLFDLKLIK